MKTWITYPAAILLGFSAHLLLGGWAPYEMTLDLVVPFLKQVGLFLVFPIVFLMFTSATASLRRFKQGAVVFSSTVLWGLLTTIILSFVGMGVAIALSFVAPAPVNNNAVYTTSLAHFSFFDFSSFRNLVIGDNAFSQFASTSISLLPFMVIALFFGIALKPDKEVLRPAYVVVNSLSEVMGRLARFFTHLGALFMLFLSAHWFRTSNVLSVVLGSQWFFVGLGASILLILIIVLPLLFSLFTLFKGGNPFRVGFGAFASFLAVGFSQNILYGTLPLLALAQRNNGVRKRVGGISVPLLTILGRGGSALVATYSIILLLGITNIQLMVLVALFSALFSFACSFSIGLEVPFIVMMVIQGVSIAGTNEIMGSIALLLPLLQLVALFIDASVISFGSAFVSRLVSPKDRVPYSEIM